MAKRTERYRKDDVQVSVYGLTVADVEDILKRIPKKSRYRLRLETAIAVDEELGYWPEEKVTAFVMADFAESYARHRRGDLASALERVHTSDLADAVCGGDWDIAMAQCLDDR